MAVNTFAKTLSLFILALALGACSVTKDSSLPKIPRPVQPANEAEVVIDSTSENERLTSFFSPADNLEEEQVRVFSQSQKSIDLAIYTFSSRKVRDLLHSKAMSGVKIRIVINKGSADSVQSFLAPLIEAGAVVKTVSTVMHHKFSIVDGDVLANSSSNMGGSRDYDENLVVCSDCSNRVHAFQREFDALFALSNAIDGQNDSQGLPTDKVGQPVHQNYPELALFTTSNFVPKFNSKKNSFSIVADRLDNGVGRVDQILAAALANAKTEVKIATGHFRSKPLYDAVASAVARGVRVTLVVDGQEYISANNQIKQDNEIDACKTLKAEWECYKTGSYFSRMLAKAGADVVLKYYSYRWYFPFSKQMHHKYMIIDGHTLYSGSYNWSYNAEYETTENVAIYSGASATALIKSFETNFDQLLSYGGGPQSAPQRIEAVKTATSPIPLHFEPISLRISQVDELLEAARTKCPSMYKTTASARFCP